MVALGEPPPPRCLPVLVPVAVEVLDRDRRLLGVDAHRADLPRRDRAGDHLRHRPTREGNGRGGGVLGLGLAVEAPQACLNTGPVAQQEAQEIQLVDAVPQRGAAALGLPLPAPRHGEVVRGAEPQRLTDRDERAPQGAAGEQVRGHAPRRCRSAAGTPQPAPFPAAAAAARISSSSSSDGAGGFSTTTCAPAANDATVWSRWTPGGVQISTTSGCSAASSSSSVS